MYSGVATEGRRSHTLNDPFDGTLLQTVEWVVIQRLQRHESANSRRPGVQMPHSCEYVHLNFTE